MASTMENDENWPEDDDRFAHFLLNTTHVTRRILSYMSARQLNTCAMVCQAWSKLVESLKKRRKTLHWMCLANEDGCEFNNQIVLDTKDFFEDVFTEPHYVFMFCQSDLSENQVTLKYKIPGKRRKKVSYSNFPEFVKTLLPKHCELIGFSSGGVVGTDFGMKLMEIEEELSVTFMCLPKLDDLDIITVDHQCEDVTGVKFETERVSQHSPESTKAILTFLTDMGMPRELNTDLWRKYGHAVIAGGHVDGLTHSSFVFPAYFPMVRYISFHSNTLKTASVILPSSISTAAEAEEQIKVLKSHNFSEDKSFAFMFACVGRGLEHYGEANVESSLFHKHFPRTPLFGFFGNGEIGFDFCSLEPRTEEACERPEKKKKKVSPPKLRHSYTTILVLFSIS